MKNHTQEINQLAIPFKLEGNILPRSEARKISTNVEHMRKVDLSIIKIRPGLNARVKPEGMMEEMWERILLIPELADAIFSNNGPATFPLGDFYALDENFYMTDGERRIRALRHLVATNRLVYPNGEPVTSVCVIINPPGTTDLERKRKVITTNETLKLTPMQKAWYYLTFKTQDGMTHEEIGKFLGVSRQTVDNYISLTEIPKEVQDKLDAGEIKMSEALAAKQKKKRPTGRIVGVDEETGEIVDERQEKKKALEEELDGDEDDFIQQDNGITFTGSRNLPEDKSSGAITVGQDSIYMLEQKKSLWKQFLHRIGRLCPGTIIVSKEQEAYVIEQLMNEYELRVK